MYMYMCIYIYIYIYMRIYIYIYIYISEIVTTHREPVENIGSAVPEKVDKKQLPGRFLLLAIFYLRLK